jgi:hypothetical protein
MPNNRFEADAVTARHFYFVLVARAAQPKRYKAKTKRNISCSENINAEASSRKQLSALVRSAWSWQVRGFAPDNRDRLGNLWLVVP